MIARLFIAFPITLIGFGIAVTIWWIFDGAYRLIRWLHEDSA